MRLRRARTGDLDSLHELLREPSVYRYLADDREPDRAFVESWLCAGIAHFARADVGLWMLEDEASKLAGCVLLEPDEAGERAELTYLLAPAYRSRGLATSMSVAVIRHAFDATRVNEIVAGADLPNTASIEVMKRLGMREWRRVDYPNHPGVEYLLRRGDPVVEPTVALPLA